MKVGIVTFFSVPNYGAMLQAYALWKYLEGRGHEVEFIDYAFGNTRRIPLWKCFVARHWHNCIDTIRKKLKFYVRFDIVHFSDAYPRTKRFKVMADLEIISNKYNAIIVGSDQMWNPAWCSGINLPVVMLDFAHERVKRISYAASFGTTVWREDQNAKQAGELLRKFAKISVREESGIKLANELSSRADVVQMLDPTLLHSADFYRKIIIDAGVDVPKHNRPTIFRYMLDEWDDAATSQKAFEFVKAKLNLEETDTDRTPVRGLLAPLCKFLGVTAKVSVPEWLAKITASDFVFTNSFHGTVFAILFHRPFVSILLRGRMSGMNERALSLLKKLGLESRAVYADDTAAIEAALALPIDWERVDAARVAYVGESQNFLQDSLRHHCLV